jgi:hypothetical protein
MQLNYMEKFFSIFGKVTLVLIILSVFIYGGYYLGKSNINFKKPEAVSIRDNKIDFATTEPTTAPTPVATKQLKTIIAGVAKDKGLSFDEYSVITPEDWIAKKESQTQLDEKLVLTKGEYSISIFQAATGGALCLYPGDADFEGPSSKFEVFVPLTTKDSRTLRRSGSLNGNAFTVCQKSGDGSYQQPTNYGHISIKLPTNYDKEILNEIDTIISSLKKI